MTVYNHAPGPCYRCLFPTPPPPETVTNCSDGGVVGVVPGIVGSLQVGSPIVGPLILFQSLFFKTFFHKFNYMILKLFLRLHHSSHFQKIKYFFVIYLRHSGAGGNQDDLWLRKCLLSAAASLRRFGDGFQEDKTKKSQSRLSRLWRQPGYQQAHRL